MSIHKVSEHSFKQSMGSFATGVVVITTSSSDKKPQGITINSFSSLSLNPAMVLFSLDKNSHSYDVFTKTKYFTANILEEKQSSLSRSFAQPSKINWDKIEYQLGKNNCPLLKNVVSYVECKLEKLYDGGDHTIIVGKVLNAQTDLAAKPLVYFRGDYYKI